MSAVLTPVRATRLSFRSKYRGISTFDVINGPMCGKTISVADSDREFFERDWGLGQHWNMSREQYERDVIGRAGFITSFHSPVTQDVIDAYRAHCLVDLERAEVYAQKHVIEGMGPDYFAARRAELAALQTARWSQETGWVATPPAI